jgi:hypothetical protein
MNRRLVVLKMLVLAMEEVEASVRALGNSRILDLALSYGKGVNLEAWEVAPFLSRNLVDVLFMG